MTDKQREAYEKGRADYLARKNGNKSTDDTSGGIGGRKDINGKNIDPASTGGDAGWIERAPWMPPVGSVGPGRDSQKSKGSGSDSQKPIYPGKDPGKGSSGNPGKGEIYIDSLSGEETMKRVQQDIERFKKENPEKSGRYPDIKKISKDAYKTSNKDIRDKIIQTVEDGIENNRFTHGEPPSKENPLPGWVSKYVEYPVVDWAALLKKFLKRIHQYNHERKYIPKNKTLIFSGGDYMTKNSIKGKPRTGVGHIVLCVDTSGSIGSDLVSGFLNQVGNVLDSIEEKTVIVDAIKCADSTIVVDRFIHKKHNFKNEQQYITMSGYTGGTDYTNPLRYFHYMLMDGQDKLKNDYPGFIDGCTNGGIHIHYRDNSEYQTLSNVENIPPAIAMIYFTDTDFFACGKYHGEMKAKSAPIDEFFGRVVYCIAYDEYDVRYGRVSLRGANLNGSAVDFASDLPNEFDELYRNIIMISRAQFVGGGYTNEQFNEIYDTQNQLTESIDDDGDDDVYYSDYGNEGSYSKDISSEISQDIDRDLKSKDIDMSKISNNQPLLVAIEDVDFFKYNTDIETGEIDMIFDNGANLIDKECGVIFNGIPNGANLNYTIHGTVYVTDGGHGFINFIMAHKPNNDDFE